MNLKRTLFLLAAVLPLQLSAKVTLPAIFTDNMVLQQQSDVKIWGRAKPGKAVKVTTSWDGKTYAATAAASGGWEVRVSTPVAGGPYTVTVSDGKPVELKNVLIGEVWLCSGQSNMEMRVADRVLNYEQEMKEGRCLREYPPAAYRQHHQPGAARRGFGSPRRLAGVLGRTHRRLFGDGLLLRQGTL